MCAVITSVSDIIIYFLIFRILCVCVLVSSSLLSITLFGSSTGQSEHRNKKILNLQSSNNYSYLKFVRVVIAGAEGSSGIYCSSKQMYWKQSIKRTR